MKIRHLSLILLSGSLIQAAHALNPGDIAFTGFNADGNDNLAFVALAPIPSGTIIYFTDEEWNGTAWATNTEAAWTWTATANIAAGAVITIDNVNGLFTPLTPTTSNLGTITAISDPANNPGFGASDEAVFAYESNGTLNANGVPNVTGSFLAAIANEDAAGSGISLAGTGLSEAAGTAILFTLDEDGMGYSGPRAGQASFADYLLLLADRTTNWTTQPTDGTLLLPFSLTPFSAGALSNTLTLSVSPADFSESATNPASTGMITRSNVTASDLVVTLTSPDTTEVTVPATVTILANQASATFDVTAVNDTLPDGNRVVTLNASAPASTGGTFAVTVQDDGDTLPATTLQVGDIAFTTFNGNRDAIAFVALDAIPAGEVIHFTDSAWDGSTVDGADHFVSGEGNVSWTAPVGGVAPGTVVVIDTYDTAPAASVGSATGGSGISSSSETIYAYQGFAVRQPITFLAAISNATLDSIVNTGLTSGSTALQVLPTGTNQAEYTGSRVNQTAIGNYFSLIGNVASNWTGGGESDFAATVPNPAAFTVFTPGSAIVDIVATASTAEGNSGNTPLNLAVSRTSDATAFTVDYAVSGGSATSGTDFTPLVSGTLTFAVGGPLSQTIMLSVLGDTGIESNETVIITLSNLVQVTGAATLGNATSTVTITNDDSVPVTFPASGSLASTSLGSIDLDAAPLTGGAEIPAFDPLSKRAFAASGVGIQVVNLTNPAVPDYITTIQPSTLGVSGLTSNDISSITVRKGTGGNPSVLAAGVINSPKTVAGHVVFLNAATGALIGTANVGVVPDHIAFTPDGTKLLVCNEGELAASATIPDPAMGTVSIIPVSPAGLPGAVQTADFTSFDAPATVASLKTAGVRLFGAGVPSTDFEPEYLAISPDGTKAMVTLQEANAVAVLDIAAATFTSVAPLGEKNFITGRHDFSDRDAAGGASGIANPTTGNPVFGLYMPDAIASYQVGGQTYYVTANEGDDRNDFITETTTVSNAGYVLDPTVFPNAANLKLNSNLGRLVVSNFSGLRGDTDGDGDIDRILSYGGRSFSILDSNGAQVFDSGDMIEMIVASQFPAQFDDNRSDAKGPEPEGVTVAKIGARTFAFVGLERAHLVLAFDVTNPLAPTYAAGFQRTGDFNPEGMVVVEASDSPTGKPLLIVASESSNTLTTFEIGQPTDFTLQLLHLADAEAGLLASSTAPNLAALVDAFDGAYPNTLILAGGDNYIPGPFAAAGTDAAVSGIETPAFSGTWIGGAHTRGNNPFAADIEIHNRIGVEASTVGNHEFDFGTNAFSDAINDTEFPYLSSNLTFSGDTGISGRYQETVAVGGLEEASSVKKKIVPSCVVTKGTEKMGLVAVTTQIIEAISSTGGVEVKGFAGDGLETNDMALLASQVQPVINDLINQGVDKIVLMSHLQQITFEQQLAPLLTGVDIILAAGSNTRLGDSNDVAVAFTGHAADFAGNYPIYTAGADGLPTVIVNTDNEFTYLGRLVADFDADGVLIVPNLLANTAVNGAYAATAANVATAWNTTEANFPTTAFATGTKGALVKQITDAVQGVITVKDGAIRGYTDVYLEGERNFVRNQETNLGDISADSMIFVGKAALPSAAHVVALKNGGGIRAAIGSVAVGSGEKLPPLANPAAGKPAGAISLLDIENSMRFNNGLMLCETTPAGLKAILEHGVANAGTGSGRFPQIGGIRFSYIPGSGATAGSRIQSIVLTDENDNITARVVSGGLVRSDAPATITIVTLNFLANGGDSYPFKANADNFRFLRNGGMLSGIEAEANNFTAAGVVPADILGEQLAFSNYLQSRYATPATAYDIAETVPALDTRIQSSAVRMDNVLAGPATFGAWLALNGYTSGGINTDSDSDGSTDLVEYFFNQSPNSGSDNGNLLQIANNAGARELRFAINNQTTSSGYLQVSSDLASWSDALAGVDYTVANSVVSGDETAFTYALPGSGPSAPGVSATYIAPNTTTPFAKGATLGGVRVVNEGLVGVGRLSGETLDSFGETLGASSGLSISGWAWNGNQFSGKFNVLPDRGYNTTTVFSNYAARLHEVDFTFVPYYGTASAGQGQIVPTYNSTTTKFTYLDGATTKFTTGLNPTGTSTILGQTVGTVTAANGPGGAQVPLISFDAEAVHLFADGSGYVSDEYGTYIARFNASKQITGITQLPESARPHRPLGTLNFDSASAPTNGRRNNQGLEGMSVTPDGNLLFALMQSALVQDTGSNASNRNNTRLFVYNVAGANRETPVLIGEYIVTLPRIDSDGNASLDATAAQSEIIAINGTSFLMLPRDGNGLGRGTTAAIVFKSVQVVDFASATNILGTYEAEGASVMQSGALAPGLKAAAAAEVINMLNPTDLAKFGLNTNTAAPNGSTLNEKMEGMALVPDLSTPQANDFFLFIANDNDFQSSNVQMLNAAGVFFSANGQTNVGNGALTNDAMFYAYRVTIDGGGKRFYRFDIE